MFTAYLFVAFSFLVLLTLKVEDNSKLNVIFSVFWIISIPLICLILLLDKFRIEVDAVSAPAGLSKFGFRKAVNPNSRVFAVRAFGYELRIWRWKNENL
jgi:hypothetical protein